MAKVKGTSNIPMIMGIIGGVLSLPSALCSGLCASSISVLNEAAKGSTEQQMQTAAAGVGAAVIILNLIPGALGLIFGCLGKAIPTPAGILMILAAIGSLVVTIMTANILAVVISVLFVIGGIFCFTQPKVEVTDQPS